MRKGFLGSIAALAAGAGAAWGQAPMPVAPAGGTPAAIAPASIGPAGDVIPVQGPAPVLMPPIAVGPPGDPLGMGPTAGIGPPPSPMYPMPGPPGAPMYQPAPPGYGGAPRVYFRGEYLLFFAPSQPAGAFPLLTTGSPSQGGVPGQPTTTQLITGDNIDYGAVSGMRLGGGFYGDADRRFGFDFTSMYTQPTLYKKEFRADVDGSAGIPILARPYVDTTTLGASSLVVVSPELAGAVPGQTNRGIGNARISTSTATWSADPSAMWNIFRSSPESKCQVTVDALVGYKFLQVHEDFQMNSNTALRGFTVVPTFVPGPFGVPVQTGTIVVPTAVGVGGVTTATPATVTVADRFVTTNNFNGGNFGLRTEIRYGMWSLHAVGKVAVGNMHQTLRIRGITSFEDHATGRSGYAFGGLYANTSNIGTYTHDEFCIIPEVNLNIGINLTKSLSMYMGYNFVYVSRVIRPGNQLTPFIDSTTIPFSSQYGNAGGVPGVMKALVQDDFWLQGVSFGFAFKY